jgi:hypothetical protein
MYKCMIHCRLDAAALSSLTARRKRLYEVQFLETKLGWPDDRPVGEGARALVARKMCMIGTASPL